MTSMFIGVITAFFYYLIVLSVGIWSGRKQKSTRENPDTIQMTLAGRSIGLVVGSFSMIATWVGSEFISETTDSSFDKGILWSQAPLGYAISLLLGGLIFAKKMRGNMYVTVIDPIEEKFGCFMGVVLALLAILVDICWSAHILYIFGESMYYFLDLESNAPLIFVTSIAVIYTLYGGLYSIAATHILQLFFIFIGLLISIIFAYNDEAVKSISERKVDLIGKINEVDAGTYVDLALKLILGSIPYQVYFQRVLSARTESIAVKESLLASAGCMIVGVLPILAGLIAKMTDWSVYKIEPPKAFVLPHILKYLTPESVSYLGVFALLSAVVSSIDSLILSSSTTISRNIFMPFLINYYRAELKSFAILRISIFLVAITSCTMGVIYEHTYLLYILSSDLIYIILLPQLFCALFIKFSNFYGSLSSFIIGLTLRLLAGEGESFYAVIKYPLYDTTSNFQRFPHRTFAMIISLITLIAVSFFSELIIGKVNANKTPKNEDIAEMEMSCEIGEFRDLKYVPLEVKKD